MKVNGIIRLLLIVAISTVTSWQSRAQEQTVDGVLQDSLQRSEIMKAICNDHAMMNEMMIHMMSNAHAKEMVTQNSEMRHQMMRDKQMMSEMMEKDTAMAGMMMEHMMEMMEKDSGMCKMMRQKMMGNEHMKRNMMNGKDGNKMMCPMHDWMKEKMKNHNH